jgi:hypothetical protein
MKLTKFAFTAMVAALAVWTSSAQIIPGGPYRYEKINFKLVVEQQALIRSNSAPATYVSTVKTMRMTNKDLLKYMAEAFHTSWPAGAQLALLSDTREIFPVYRELYVLDKAGNPLWNASEGYYVNETNYAFFSINCRLPVTAEKDVDQSPSENVSATHHYLISFQLYRSDDTDPSAYTDLNFQGLNTEKYRFNLNYSGYTRRLSISDHVGVEGDGLINDTWAVVSGHVTVAGKWKNIF